MREADHLEQVRRPSLQTCMLQAWTDRSGHWHNLLQSRARDGLCHLRMSGVLESRSSKEGRTGAQGTADQ
eukprot:CAMPEP_0113970412 /NCGR_PEP_ID=MMETSP0011_2-20120614/11165_1 /TAXON_ID=101924 /ORGANISM="Rhodosorus marinus" /LENGTH=69 /DNA_ID=CAMNT_0000984791 /DNA_START=33 /DNA_END=242 /DNA_ORIENTATION=- /assembly_acc=CAM_ASM_000156